MKTKQKTKTKETKMKKKGQKLKQDFSFFGT